MRCVVYRCKQCFAEWVEKRPADGAVDDSACACGGAASWTRIIAGELPEPSRPVCEGFVKGGDYQFDPQFAVQSQHASRGAKSGAYKRATREKQQREINRQKEIDRTPCKGKHDVPKFLGSMSMEMATSIGLQEGDPNTLLKDPEHFLKATGRHTGA
jgi:hypothetical protein